MVAALREASERLLAEGVDAATDPLVESRRLAEACHQVVVEVDYAEGRAQRDDGDRRGGASFPVEGEQLREVDVNQLVAVEREQVTLLTPRPRGEANPSSPSQRLGLRHGHDLRAQATERRLEGAFLAGPA